MAKAFSEAHQFLPAALEIEATPPSPIGRLMIWAIVALFACAILWASIGMVDIVAIARGKVVPTGRVKVVQALATSVVRAIHVADGQAVRAGQVLLELDPTFAEADRERVRTELTAVEAELERSHALLLASKANGTVQLTEARVTPAARLQRDLLDEAYRGYDAELSRLEQSIQQAAADQRSATASVEKYEKTLPLVTERTEAVRALAKEHLVSRTQVLELEQEQIEIENDLAAQRAMAQSAQARRAGVDAERRRIVAEFRSKVLTRIEELERQRLGLNQEQIKADRQRAQQTLRAPVDGIVQQLAVHTVGGVVSPAETLLVLVPRDGGLEVEAYVENKDIGFVTGKQVAEVKVDSFPFTRYGVIDGEVITLSDDAVSIEGVGLVYSANVRLAKTSLAIDGKMVNLSPGMAVTVEIKTGKRRLIEFLLSPVLRYKAESARER